ncbi:hypothetical protein AMECASPLE_039231, partial [Ameca splendens]
VCGSVGDVPCTDSPCGGAGCRDDEGNRHCGGLNCNGAVAAADNALERSKHAEKELNKAMGEMQELFTKVQRGSKTTDEVYIQASTYRFDLVYVAKVFLPVVEGK